MVDIRNKGCASRKRPSYGFPEDRGKKKVKTSAQEMAMAMGALRGSSERSEEVPSRETGYGQVSVKTATFAAKQLLDLIRWPASSMMTQQRAARNVPSLLGKKNITEAMNMNSGDVQHLVSITETLIHVLGVTPGCRTCQAARSSSILRYFKHTPECRERLTDLIRQDERFGRLVEAVDQRQVEFKDIQHKAARKQRKQQREEQHRSADAGARGTGEALRSQREEPGGPAHAGTRGTGGASGSQGFGVDRKRRADHHFQPDHRDEDGDCEIGIPLGAEPPDGDRRQRGGDDVFPPEALEPARQRSHLLSQSSITHWF